MTPKGVKSSSEGAAEMFKCNTATHDIHYIEVLIAREIGSDNTVLRTALTFVASLSAGRPTLTFGYVPTKKGALQMT
eukprot:8748961-Pyramimonas_sp.AAC.1